MGVKLWFTDRSDRGNAAVPWLAAWNSLVVVREASVGEENLSLYCEDVALAMAYEDAL